MWEIGQKVAYYGTHSSRVTSIETIEKIYKTGHLLVNGRRYRPGHGDTAHATGEGWSKPRIAILTPGRIAEFETVNKERRIRAVAEWLARAPNIPDDLLQSLEQLQCK